MEDREAAGGAGAGTEPCFGFDGDPFISSDLILWRGKQTVFVLWEVKQTDRRKETRRPALRPGVGYHQEQEAGGNSQGSRDRSETLPASDTGRKRRVL